MLRIKRYDIIFSKSTTNQSNYRESCIIYILYIFYSGYLHIVTVRYVTSYLLLITFGCTTLHALIVAYNL